MRSELFLLAVTTMLGEHAFYESAWQRQSRYVELIHAATLDDPEWTALLLVWLRTTANMRTAAIVGAAEFARARLQAALYQHALDRRHKRDSPIPASLVVLTRRKALMAMPWERRRSAVRAAGGAQLLADAGMTWESLAGWLQGPVNAPEWRALIPSMGYMALLRNLRNFDAERVSDSVAAEVAARLADPSEVARSRQLPLRFLAAYRAASPGWASISPGTTGWSW